MAINVLSRATEPLVVDLPTGGLMTLELVSHHGKNNDEFGFLLDTLWKNVCVPIQDQLEKDVPGAVRKDIAFTCMQGENMTEPVCTIFIVVLTVSAATTQDGITVKNFAANRLQETMIALRADAHASTPTPVTA